MYCTVLLKEWKTSCGLQIMKVPWYYLTNAIKRATFPNNKVYECQTKDDISWQFICVSLLAIPKNWLQTILCRSCIFSFHYPFNFLTRMSNAANNNKYAWQFHFVVCYVGLYHTSSCDNNNCNNAISLSHWYIMSITLYNKAYTFWCNMMVLPRWVLSSKINCS